MNSERDNILARIREALQAPTPPPSPASPQNVREWLPKSGGETAQCWATFMAQTAALKATVKICASLEEARSQLATLAAEEAWQRIGTHGGGLAADLAVSLTLPTLNTSAPYETAALEACSVGITECDALVAQTGSVLLTSRSGGGRALSVLPPHHVVIARGEQLVADLPAAYDLLQEKYGGNWPSFMTFITGPSRTGDIERILVLGAHGPKQLTILILP